MSEKTESEHEEKTVNEAVTAPGGAATRETRVEKLKVERAAPRRTNRTAVVAVVAVVALAVLAFLLWRTYSSGGGGGGRPVPAPRTVNVEQPGGAGGTGASTSEPTLTIPPEAAARAGIKVEPVGEQPATESEGSAATGVVQSNAYRETPVVSLVGGVVRSVNAELGQSVRRGQALAVVFSDELATAQSRYLAAVAELEEHHKHHHRTVELVEIGAASREEFEQSESMLKKAEAEVASLRQRLLLLGLSPQRVDGLRSSSQVSLEVSLPSPVSGTVINRSANPGEVVEANKEILRVADLSSVWVIGQVYEKDLGRVRVGSGASITSPAYPGRVFRGQVSYVDPRLDPATRTAQVRIELANPGQVLKIGMYVGVAFATIGGSEHTVPVVPAAAVQNINNRQVVFVATNDPNVFVMRPVRVGPEAGGRVPVLEGLFVGDRVVTEGSFMLRAEWLKLHPGGQ
jgi:cobalt-zinc-cadmium efflux system membrane fusion protein